MLVNRRIALKRLVLVSAGAALLPACFHNHAKPSATTRNFQLSGDQEQQLEELTALIIPSGATPGAREVSAHRFVLRMLDDCFSKDDRDKYLRGFASFLQTEPAQRANLLTGLESAKLSDEALGFFYTTTKKLTIDAYVSSQYYLTRVQVYELVPGRWHGCVPVKTPSNTPSNTAS
jgi:hypothetical protein